MTGATALDSAADLECAAGAFCRVAAVPAGGAVMLFLDLFEAGGGENLEFSWVPVGSQSIRIQGHAAGRAPPETHAGAIEMDANQHERAAGIVNDFGNTAKGMALSTKLIFARSRQCAAANPVADFDIARFIHGQPHYTTGRIRPMLRVIV
jgi:hypothetical protein